MTPFETSVDQKKQCLKHIPGLVRSRTNFLTLQSDTSGPTIGV